MKQQDIDHKTYIDPVGHHPKNPDFTALRPSKDTCVKSGCDDSLTDSILDDIRDDSFRDVPSSQLAFQQDVFHRDEKHRCLDADKTSTPNPERSVEYRSKREETDVAPKARKSMTDHLKRAMMCNAAAPSGVSRTTVQKEAVLTEQISVAMQAMESVSMEATDLGPFFGLPTKVKELICNLKEIKDLYGEYLASSSIVHF